MRSSIQIHAEKNFELMLQYASKAGFKEVSINFGDCEVIFKDNFDAHVEEMCALLEKYNLKCTQTHLPCYHLLTTAQECDNDVEASIIQALEASSKLGAEWAAYHPRTDISAGYNQQTSFQFNKDKLQEYLEYAEKYNIGIAVENMPLYPYTFPEWRFFGGGWEELILLCDSFNSDKMGICWDFGHAHTATLDQPNAFKDIGDRLKITHVHDNYKNGDHHQLPLLHNYKLWKSINWESVINGLKSIEYKGPLTLELIFPPEPMLESFVKCGYECLNHLKTLGGEV